jgi:hypothetical protein
VISTLRVYYDAVIAVALMAVVAIVCGLITAVLGLGIGISAHAASEIDCMVMWNKADVFNNGTLKGKEATTYLDAIRKSGRKYEMKTVGQLSSTEFMAACKDDTFKISFYRV